MLTPTTSWKENHGESKLSREILAWDRFIRLVSLWEMIKTYAHDLVELTGQIQACAGTVGSALAIDRFVPQRPNHAAIDMINVPVMFEQIEDRLSKAETLCADLNLKSASAHIARARSDWPHLQGDLERFTDYLREIRQRIEDDLKAIYFQFIPESKLEFYEGRYFGAEAEARFSDAVDDMREAGRCFALERYSGAVLHCMGVVQAGLEHLAKDLKGVKLNMELDDWGKIVTKLKDGIDRKRDRILGQKPTALKKAKWARLEPFYADVILEVQAMKNAWRNPGFHFRRRDFDEPKAREVLQAVRNFMRNLAVNLPL